MSALSTKKPLHKIWGAIQYPLLTLSIGVIATLAIYFGFGVSALETAYEITLLSVLITGCIGAITAMIVHAQIAKSRESQQKR